MTENSLALYRKYRPHTFADVRNQEHIVSVLKGAIAKNMVPHALLFTGSRGTGKTTVARIFAHAIGASDVDIYEIDAASNRGIDDIRELKNAVHTLPYESPRKVYIIDEVHMLTKEAFNALLKTLEEPPAHVVFILATTERDKLLDTITSRCQIFEFRTPTRAELRDTVLNIAVQEHFTLAESGADIIALAADGSYRDALGITQKVMMASGDAVLEADEIAVIVGAPKNALLRDLITALHDRSIVPALAAVQAANDARVDMKLFMRLLLERVRAILLVRHGGDETGLLQNFGAEEQALIRTYAADKKSPIHSHLLMRLLTAAGETGATHIPYLPLELALIELCTLEHA
jgi:DNA polymerase-3 subunit gamma/tau